MTSSKIERQLPRIPADIRVCFDHVVKPPQGEDITQQQVFDLIAEFRRSDQAKSMCGKRLIQWYDSLSGHISK